MARRQARGEQRPRGPTQDTPSPTASAGNSKVVPCTAGGSGWAGRRPRLEASVLKPGDGTGPPAGARWQGFSPCPGEQGGTDTGHGTQRRGHGGCTCAAGASTGRWSWHGAQTSNPACPLKGHSRHPEDFGSLRILVIGSGVLRARVRTPRRSLCSLHGTPPPLWRSPPHMLRRPMETESLHAYRALPEGPRFLLPNLTATSLVLLDALTCRHM